MKTQLIVIAGLSALSLTGLFSVTAQAANMNTLEARSHWTTRTCSQPTCDTNLNVEFKLYNTGPDHVCRVDYTTNAWVTRGSGNGAFVRIDGTGEIWRATALAKGKPASFEYQVSCTDLSGSRGESTPAGWVITPSVTLSMPIKTIAVP